MTIFLGTCENDLTDSIFKKYCFQNSTFKKISFRHASKNLDESIFPSRIGPITFEINRTKKIVSKDSNQKCSRREIHVRINGK